MHFKTETNNLGAGTTAHESGSMSGFCCTRIYLAECFHKHRAPPKEERRAVGKSN